MAKKINIEHKEKNVLRKNQKVIVTFVFGIYLVIFDEFKYFFKSKLMIFYYKLYFF